MKKKVLYIGLGVLALVLIGGSVFEKYFKKESVTEVETLDIQRLDIVQTVSATGKIQPEIEVKISPEVSGEIIDLPIKEGQVVQKGDLLIRINPDLYESGVERMVASVANSRAGLNQAEAQLAEAYGNYERNKKLFDKGVISGAEWDKVMASYTVAKAARNAAFYNVESVEASLKESKDNRNRTTIYSPVSGTISRLDVELGERVVGTMQMAGTELLRVANLNNMEVEVDVNENDIVKIAVGNNANIEVDAFLKKKFKGVVTSISNSASATLTADQVTNFKVKVRILESSYQDLMVGKDAAYSPFRPGMTATVDILTQTNKGVLAVPIRAIVMKADSDTLSGKKEQDGLKESIFVLRDGAAVLRHVTTGIQDDQNIEVVEGVDEKDVVVVGPYSLVSRELKEGDRIKSKETSK